MIKTLKMILTVAIFVLGFNAGAVSAATVNFADYLIPSAPGLSWTYKVTEAGEDFPSLGEEFTVTSPYYEDPSLNFPVSAETGIVTNIGVGENIILNFESSLTVLAGTFNNVLRIDFLDSGVITAIDYFAVGVGFIKTTDVVAFGGNPSGNFELLSVNSVPVPAAVWLFGSGLLGLIGLARRKA